MSTEPGEKEGVKSPSWAETGGGASSDTVLTTNSQGDGESVSQVGVTLRQRASPSCRERRQDEVAMGFSDCGP